MYTLTLMKSMFAIRVFFQNANFGQAPATGAGVRATGQCLCLDICRHIASFDTLHRKERDIHANQQTSEK